MGRRSVGLAAIAGLLGILVPYTTTRAQHPSEVPRVGVLVNGSPTKNPAVEALVLGLAQLGYVDGRSVIIETRYAEAKLDRLPALAAELVGMNVDAIVTFGGPASNAAYRATKVIPIVFAIVADPVALGFTATLSRPGGNATGLTNNDPDQARLQLALLKELRPNLERVVILSDQDIPGSDANGMAPIERTSVAAAQSLGLQSQVLKLRGPTPDLQSAFKAMADANADALLVLEVPVTLVHRKRIAELAIAQRLLSMFPAGSSDAGGVVSYGTNVVDTWSRVPAFVDRILKGPGQGTFPWRSLRVESSQSTLRQRGRLGSPFLPKC